MSAVPSLDEDMEQGLVESVGPQGGAGPALRRARAWLSRAAEPGSVQFWRFVEEAGPVEAVRRLRHGRAPDVVRALVGARLDRDASLSDLLRAHRCGARLVIPEDD
jgi:DNA processing protein